MHHASHKVINLALIRNGVTKGVLTPNINTRSMSYMHTKTLKGAAKVYANDSTGKHPHLLETSCEKPECSSQVCTTPCDKQVESQVKGHFTHKPPIGRNCKFLSEKDCHQVEDAQYFIRAVPVKNPISAKDITKFQKKKDIENHEKGTEFCRDNEELLRKIAK